MNWAFDRGIKPRQLSVDVVESTFPINHYGNILHYEAWPLRRIMENLVELGLMESEMKKTEKISKPEVWVLKVLRDELDFQGWVTDSIHANETSLMKRLEHLRKDAGVKEYDFNCVEVQDLHND